MSNPLPKRLEEFHSDRWIENVNSNAVLQEMNFIRLMAGKKDRPFGIAITKQSGGGKTAIINQFDRITSKDSLKPGSVKHAIIEMPYEPKTFEIKEEILRAIGSPVGKHVNKETFKRIILQGNYKLIIIDEFHNMLGAQKTQLTQCLNCIKWITNVCNVSFILFGTNAIVRVFEYDAQFSTRFRTVEIPSWENDIVFKKFIAEYLSHLPINAPDSVPSELFDILLSCGNTKRIIEVLC